MQKYFIIIIVLLTSSFAYSKDYKTDLEKIENLESRVEGTSKNKSLDRGAIYLNLSELSKEFRNYAPNFHDKVIEDIKNGKPLHGRQLTILHKLVSIYVSLDYQLRKFTNESIIVTYNILGHLERVENLDLGYSKFYLNKKFRRLVNAADRSYSVARKELKKSIRKLIKRKNLKKLRENFNKFRTLLEDGEISENNHFVQLASLHEATKKIKSKGLFKKLRKKMFGQTLSDFGQRVTSVGLHHLSGAFGNGAGAIRWRKGFMWKKPKILEGIREQLMPLDVITEKTRFALTDTFIPGHFGHNAIWLGSKEQLQTIGMWDHPSIVPHQKKISEGYSIIETDRSGTHLKRLKDFMNVDEFGILRLKSGIFSREKMLKIYKVAIAQLGKTYDFNFDVETTDKLVCSELLYQAFGDIHWPTEDIAGRTTISPDNVVSLALYNNSPLELVYLISAYKDDVLIHQDSDDLAKDIGFVKHEDGYKKPVKVCKRVKKKRPGSRVRHGSPKNITVKKCHTEYEALNYVGHDVIADIDL